MPSYELFVVLDEVESTNNYAMAQAHAGLARHGQAFFAHNQWGGKGQRGKSWASAAGQNIILSVVLKPNKAFSANTFYLSALIANICRLFFEDLSNTKTFVKWPNDIYVNDRKAGGILIENIFKGNEWQWVVVGIGININQTEFEGKVTLPISLKTITGIDYEAIALAKQLYNLIMAEIEQISVNDLPNILATLNDHLYKKNKIVKLKKENAVFETTIIKVTEYGELRTQDVVERSFNVGEVDWIF